MAWEITANVTLEIYGRITISQNIDKYCEMTYLYCLIRRFKGVIAHEAKTSRISSFRVPHYLEKETNQI